MPPPDRPTKRAKVTDETQSSNDNYNPVVVASSSTVTVAKVEVDVKRILLSLFDSKTEDEATKIMESLSGGQAVMSPANCQKLCDLQGVPTILYTIQRFKTSTTLVSEALRRLITISCYINEAKMLLIDLDFHKTLLTLAKAHTDSRQIQTNTTCLLGNLSCIVDPQSKNRLGTNDIIQFMRDSMATFPDCLWVVKSACLYFKTMSDIPELKDRLLENEIVQPLAAMFQKFRKREYKEDEKKRVEYIVDSSKKAMVTLLA